VRGWRKFVISEGGAIGTALRGSMKLLSRNCRGLGNQPAVRGLTDLVKAKDPDILFLSETKMTEKEMDGFVGS
jgi:hypothetical protein